MISLYNLLNYKKKNSVFKSVYVGNYLENGLRRIEVEPYDKTGYNALNSTPSRYDSTLKIIEKALKAAASRLPRSLTHNNKKFYIIVYSEKFGQFEYIFDPIANKIY